MKSKLNDFALECSGSLVAPKNLATLLPPFLTSFGGKKMVFQDLSIPT